MRPKCRTFIIRPRVESTHSAHFAVPESAPGVTKPITEGLPTFKAEFTLSHYTSIQTFSHAYILSNTNSRGNRRQFFSTFMKYTRWTGTQHEKTIVIRPLFDHRPILSYSVSFCPMLFTFINCPLEVKYVFSSEHSISNN